MKLYHCLNARSFRPLWALEELGLKYELVMLPFPPRALQKQYFELNPLGTVPAFIDGDTFMTESAAICDYLAARYANGHFNVLPHELAFGRYLNFLHFGETTLTFPQTLVLRYGRFENPERRQPQVVDDYSKWFLARLRAVADRLSENGGNYLCGERFTAADVSVGYALLLAEHTGLAAQFTEPTLRYWERLKSRPSFSAALQAQQHAAAEQNVTAAPF